MFEFEKDLTDIRSNYALMAQLSNVGAVIAQSMRNASNQTSCLGPNIQQAFNYMEYATTESFNSLLSQLVAESGEVTDKKLCGYGPVAIMGKKLGVNTKPTSELTCFPDVGTPEDTRSLGLYLDATLIPDQRSSFPGGTLDLDKIEVEELECPIWLIEEEAKQIPMGEYYTAVYRDLSDKESGIYKVPEVGYLILINDKRSPGGNTLFIKAFTTCFFTPLLSHTYSISDATYTKSDMLLMTYSEVEKELIPHDDLEIIPDMVDEVKKAFARAGYITKPTIPQEEIMAKVTHLFELFDEKEGLVKGENNFYIRPILNLVFYHDNLDDGIELVKYRDPVTFRYKNSNWDWNKLCGEYQEFVMEQVSDLIKVWEALKEEITFDISETKYNKEYGLKFSFY